MTLPNRSQSFSGFVLQVTRNSRGVALSGPLGYRIFDILSDILLDILSDILLDNILIFFENILIFYLSSVFLSVAMFLPSFSVKRVLTATEALTYFPQSYLNHCPNSPGGNVLFFTLKKATAFNVNLNKFPRRLPGRWRRLKIQGHKKKVPTLSWTSG